MTEIHIPYLPSAKFFKVLCRLGVHEQDISSDTDSNPQIRTIGGTVTISASIGRFRYTEADGRSRVIYNKTETYNIQTSTGELFDVDGNLGVNLLDTTSPGIDPQGWTYKATVRPTGGEPFDVDIPASLEPGGTLDLGDGLVFTPSTGTTSLETRVKALEDAAGTITLPAGGGSLTTITADTTTPPGTTVGALVGYTNTSAVARTVNGVQLDPGAWIVMGWSGSSWVQMSTGTLGAAPDTPVTPAEPTFTDLSGISQDTYTIPAQTGVVYAVGGSPQAAGAYPGTGTVTITASAASGYTLATGATTSWTHTFDTTSANTAPSMTLGQETITGLTVTQPFTTSDVDGDPVTVTANWGDGQSGTVTSPASHTYAAGGTYSATFTPNDGTTNGAVRTASYTVAPAGGGLPPVGNPTTFAQAVTDYGAVAHWKLNEMAGATLAESTGRSPAFALTGNPGTDYNLAAKDGYLQFLTYTGKGTAAHDADLSAGAAGLTVFALIHRQNASNNGGYILQKSGEWRLGTTYGNFRIEVTNSSGSTLLTHAITTTDMPYNQWVAIAGTIPADTSIRPTLWLNGVVQAVTSGGAAGTVGAGGAMQLGGSARHAMGNVIVFPKNLTTDHIVKLTDLARAEGLIL